MFPFDSNFCIHFLYVLSESDGVGRYFLPRVDSLLLNSFKYAEGSSIELTTGFFIPSEASFMLSGQFVYQVVPSCAFLQ